MAPAMLRGRLRLVAHLTALLVVPCAATSALAQVDGDNSPVSMRNGMPWDPDLSYPGSGYLGIDVGFTHRDLGPGASQRSFAPVVEGWYAPSERLAMSLWIPVLQSTVETPDTLDGVIRLGNVTIGGHLGVPGEYTSFMAGLELATPTARLGEAELPEHEAAVRSAFVLASLVGGHARRWLWWPERMAVVVPLRLGHRVHPGVTLSIEATGALGFAAGDDEDGGVEAAGVLTPQVSFTVDDVVTGLRAPTSVSSMRAHELAVEPFLRLFLDTAYLAAGFTLSLAGDGGFGFSSGGVWALHLGGGAMFGEGGREPRDAPHEAGGADGLASD